MSDRLSEPEYEEIKASLNNAIHEIVFAVQHAGDDNFEDAAACLLTVQMTIDRVAEKLVEVEAREVAA